MVKDPKRIHYRAAKSIAGWKDIALLDDGPEVVVEGPRFLSPVFFAVGATYAMNVWFKGAETVLPDRVVEMLDRYGGWVRPQFVRINVDVTAPGIWFETAVRPSDLILSKRDNPTEPWKPMGVGWKPVRGDDGESIWFRARTWEVYR